MLLCKGVALSGTCNYVHTWLGCDRRIIPIIILQKFAMTSLIFSFIAVYVLIKYLCHGSFERK